jgi:hypothetical protein
MSENYERSEKFSQYIKLQIIQLSGFLEGFIYTYIICSTFTKLVKY